VKQSKFYLKMTSSIIYQGNLRCQATHLQSTTILETDAPTDNKGKGERFAVCIVSHLHGNNHGHKSG
jgi:hypothetical protein